VEVKAWLGITQGQIAQISNLKTPIFAYNMRKSLLILSIMSLLFMAMESCGGSKGLGKGKQKKSCNCGF
jgi:hypothetical protein